MNTFDPNHKCILVKYLSQFISIAIVVTLVTVSFLNQDPRGSLKDFQNNNAYSIDSVLKDLEVISAAPHYYGTEAHEDVREYLQVRLESLGIQTQIQEDYIYDEDYNTLIKPKNILGRIKGSERGKALLITAHYDSAPISSYGASDAGSGVATILECLRVFLMEGKKPKNDIIILFSDAEELGLLGAKLFMKEHPWAQEVGFVINFEARGSSGANHMIIETNNGNSKILKGFLESDVKNPVASSLLYSIYKLLPNDTDSTVYREYGDIDGIFFAYIDDFIHYHTENDNINNVSIASLYQQSSNLLSLMSHFANLDLTELKSKTDSVYINVPFVKIIQYPFSWVLPLLIIAVVSFIIIIVYGIKKRQLQLKLILKGFVPFVISLVAAGIFGFGGWWLILKIYPNYNDLQHNFTYNGYYYIIFFTFISVLIIATVYKRYYSKNDVKNSLIAPLFFWLVINLLIFLFLKGAGFFIIPVFFSLISTLLVIKYDHKFVILTALLSAPLLFIFSPLVEFIPVILGLNALFVSCFLTVFIFGLLLPVYGYFKQKERLIICTFLISFLSFFIAHTKSDYNEKRKKPNSLVYFEDKDNGKATLATYDDKVDEWLMSNLGRNVKESYPYIDSIYKRSQNFTYYREIQSQNIKNSSIQILEQTIKNEKLHLRFTIKPNRLLDKITLYLDKKTKLDSQVLNGLTIKSEDRLTSRISSQLVKYYPDSNKPFEVYLTASRKYIPLKIVIEEISFDLFDNNLLKELLKPRTSDKMVSPYYESDAIITKSTFNIK